MTSTNNAEETGFKQDVDRLGQGVHTLKNDARDVAHEAVDVARSGAAEIQQGAHRAVDAAKHKLGDAKEAATDAAASLKHIITQHPMASLGVAAGVGLLLGMVMSRPRS